VLPTSFAGGAAVVAGAGAVADAGVDAGGVAVVGAGGTTGEGVLGVAAGACAATVGVSDAPLA
jgi:hypothetical protein